MLMKNYLGLLFFLLSVFNLRAQTPEIEELQQLVETTKGYEKTNALIELGKAYIVIDTVKAEKYLDQGRKLAEKKGDKRLLTKVGVQYAALDLRKIDLQSCLKRCIELMNEPPDKLKPDEYGSLLVIISNALGKLGVYQMAIDYRKEYLKISSNPKDIQYFFAADNIAQYYGQLGVRDSALVYFKKSAEIALDQKIPGLYMTALTNVAYYYNEIGNLKKSDAYFMKVQNYFDTVPGKNIKDSLIYSLYLNTFATACFKQHRLEKCESLLQKAKEIQQVYHFQKNTSSDFLEVDLYLEKRNPQKALQILESVSDKIQNKQQEQEYFRLLAKTRLRLGDAKGSEAALEKYTKIAESGENETEIQRRLVDLTKSQLKQTVENLKTSHQLALKERDVERLKKAQMYNWIIVIVIFVLIIIGFVVLRMKKNKRIFELKTKLYEEKQKLNQLKEAQLQNELIFKDQDLTDLAIHINRKGEFLEGLQKMFSDLRKKAVYDEQIINKAILDMKEEIRYDKNLLTMQDQVDKINHKFSHYMLTNYPDMTPVEIEVCSLIRLNKSSKEIASVKGIEESSIKTYRYRIRQKLGLLEKENLNSFLVNLKI